MQTEELILPGRIGVNKKTVIKYFYKEACLIEDNARNH